MADADLRPQRDAVRTRAAILSAAQEAFSRTGYSNTGVRDITAAAGVNPALVSRYFGSKERLYEEALSALLDASLITNIPRERFGETVVAILTATTPGQFNPLRMMMLASADPIARSITERLLHAVFLGPMTRWFGAEEGVGKAACFTVLASGLTVYRELYPLDPVGPGMSDATRAWLVGAFQSLVD